MTVSSTPLVISYSCNGSDRLFTFPFGIGLPEELKVTLIDSGAVSTVLTYPDDYSVTGTPIAWDVGHNPIAWDYTSGGQIITVSTYDTGNTLVISTNIPLTQDSVFTSGMGLLYEDFEDALDKLTRIAKQQDARILALELFIISGIVTPTSITYLGSMASDPDTTGWGMDRFATVWSNASDKKFKYWDGSQILILG